MSDNFIQQDESQPQKKRRGPRPRATYTWIVGFLVIAISLLTDPDSGFLQHLPFGAGTVATLIILSKGVLYCTLLNYTRKALMDYVKFEEVWHRSKQSATGAGLFAIALGIMTLAFSLAIYTAVTH